MNTDHLLHPITIAIDVHYCALRLAEKLINASFEQAKYKLNIRAAFTEAIGLYSAKAARKQAFQVYDEIIHTIYDGIRLASLIGEYNRCQLPAKQL